MSRLAVALGLVVILVSGAGLVAGSATGPAPADRDGNVMEVELRLRHSRFVPSEVVVPVGATVRFVVRNTDPIDHELIVGPQAVQDAHEAGTHAVHGTVPGEVSVPAGSSAATTYRFDEPGTVLMGCHLPGHWAYGMRGQVRVG